MFPSVFSLLSKVIHTALGVSTPGSFPPPLPEREEKQCFAAMADGDNAARERLIVHNLRLVWHIVRKYYSSYKDREDLQSVGTLGLIKAVDSYRADSGTKFATYAAKCIQNAIIT